VALNRTTTGFVVISKSKNQDSEQTRLSYISILTTFNHFHNKDICEKQDILSKKFLKNFFISGKKSNFAKYL
jgi:hypothetical protein